MTKIEKVKMGIVGFGNMGTGHCESIHSGKIENMELAAICKKSLDSDEVTVSIS